MTIKPSDLDSLFQAALAAAGQAYAPYSNYQVGAALMADNGQIYAGCNVETANYKGVCCAEGGAIAAMIAGGGRIVRDLAVICQKDDFCVPCGNCRQIIREFATPETRIHAGDRHGGNRRAYLLTDLLPESFGPDNLAEAHATRKG